METELFIDGKSLGVTKSYTVEKARSTDKYGFKLFKDNGLFGVCNNTKECVPAVHKGAGLAILEWEWFESLNSCQRFMDHEYSLLEIELIKSSLIEQMEAYES